MAHYVLLPRSRSISTEARRLLIKQSGVQIIDEYEGKALLVDATEEGAKSLRETFTDWIITRETVYMQTAHTDRKVDSKSENLT